MVMEQVSIFSFDGKQIDGLPVVCFTDGLKYVLLENSKEYFTEIISHSEKIIIIAPEGVIISLSRIKTRVFKPVAYR
jgi:hypothetical protein